MSVDKIIEQAASYGHFPAGGYCGFSHVATSNAAICSDMTICRMKRREVMGGEAERDILNICLKSEAF